MEFTVDTIDRLGSPSVSIDRSRSCLTCSPDRKWVRLQTTAGMLAPTATLGNALSSATVSHEPTEWLMWA